MATKSIKDGTVADAYLAPLADRGVDYFFGNAGTDFAPIIEAFAKAAAMARAVDAAVNHGRQALLNVVCSQTTSEVPI